MVQSKSWVTRKWAVRLLAARGGAGRHADALLSQLEREGHSDVAKALTEALGALEAIDEARLIGMVQSKNWVTRKWAVRRLAAKGGAGRHAGALLSQLEREGDSDVAKALTEALGALEAIDEARLIGMVQSKNWVTRKWAVRLLAAKGGAGRHAGALLSQLERERDSDVAKALTEALGALEAIDEARLIGMVQSKSSVTREGAVRLLAARGGAGRHADALLSQLEREGDSDVAKALTEALGALEAIDEARLIGMVQSKSSVTREGAVRLLADGGRVPNHLAKLIHALSTERDATVAATLRRSLIGVRQAPRDVPTEVLEALLQRMLDELQRDILDKLPDSVLDRLVRNRGALRELLKLRALPNPSREQIESAMSRIRGGRVHTNELLAALKSDDELIVGAFRQTVESTRSAAGFLGFPALLAIGPLTVEHCLHVLEAIEHFPHISAELRFVAHVLGGGNPGGAPSDAEILIARIGRPHSLPQPVDPKKALRVLRKVLPETDAMPQIRADVIVEIGRLVKEANWLPVADDKAMLQDLIKVLDRGSVAHEMASVRYDQLEVWTKALTAGLWGLHILGLQMLLWIGLVLLYPRSRIVQTWFFWNPRVRRLLGFFYVGPLLLVVPFLRHRLFRPFRDELVADANLGQFDVDHYFDGSKVREWIDDNRVGRESQPLTQAIPSIRGQIILEGASGLGKTERLKYLLSRHSGRLVVYLPAFRCAEALAESGASEVVMRATQLRLEGIARDVTFLRSLLHAGALDIAIDGLNEVNAEIRLAITQFMEANPKANIMVTTQSVGWRPPRVASTRHFMLQPLTEDESGEFLRTREPMLPEEAPVRGDAFHEAAAKFLEKTVQEAVDEADLESRMVVLSNPMDLTLVAEFIARGSVPDLHELVQQQHELMAARYEEEELMAFPLERVARTAYEMRLVDTNRLQQQPAVLECMSRFRLLLRRESRVTLGKQEWLFRHDKIWEFYILRHLVTESLEVIESLIGKEPFANVLIELAGALDVQMARRLAEKILAEAQRTQNHALATSYVQRLWGRSDLPQRAA